VPAYAPALISSSSHPRRNGQAKLTWVGGWLYTYMVYPPVVGYPSKYYPGPALINFIDATNDIPLAYNSYK